MARPRVSRKANGVKVKRPMREKVYIYIQQKIASRELPAGSPISDLAIAAELHISRTPVRDALRQLVIEGFLDQTADGSVFVARLSRQDIIDLFDLREALEVHAVRKVAMRGLPSADMQRLKELNDSIQQWGQELGQKGASLTSDQTRRYKVQDMAFHTILFQAAENVRSLKTLNDVRRLIEVFTQRHAGLSIADLERAHGQHAEILTAIAAKDPDRAAKALTLHNQVSQASRLEEFARWEREAALRASIPAFFESEISSANSQPSLNEQDPLDIDA
jgi:DNA-binding GntR family transcriptional regulator